MRIGKIAIGLLCGALAVAIRAGDPVPVQFRGDWVPANAGCTSSLRFRAGVDTVELWNGADHASYGDLAWPASYFAQDYQGIIVVAIPEFSTDKQPFTIFFNADEKKGTTKLQILQGEESPNNAAYNAIVRTAKKLNTRFPLDGIPLKKCGAAAQAEVRDIRGDYAYQGKGIAKVEQKGADVRILFTWTPMGAGPHYEAKGKLEGDTITGEWYSHYAHKGWFRFVGKVSPSGDIDLSQSDDPIRSNMQRSVLVKSTR
jgi:hypothetical protein